jgi:precorrin-6Y C5,15-methyltransferase (decarboxylating)
MPRTPGPALSRTPGLPDDAFEHDGQLTKRAVRAVTLAALEPGPGLQLWDVGAGSGSIGIEWLRAEPTARAVAIEARAERAERAARNALALGVPRLVIQLGEAPGAFAGLSQPDAIFIGGGLTSPGLLARRWEAPQARRAARRQRCHARERARPPPRRGARRGARAST